MTSSALQSEVALYNTGKHFIPDELRGFIATPCSVNFRVAPIEAFMIGQSPGQAETCAKCRFQILKRGGVACHVATIYRGHRFGF